MKPSTCKPSHSGSQPSPAWSLSRPPCSLRAPCSARAPYPSRAPCASWAPCSSRVPCPLRAFFELLLFAATCHSRTLPVAGSLLFAAFGPSRASCPLRAFSRPATCPFLSSVHPCRSLSVSLLFFLFPCLPVFSSPNFWLLIPRCSFPASFSASLASCCFFLPVSLLLCLSVSLFPCLSLCHCVSPFLWLPLSPARKN